MRWAFRFDVNHLERQFLILSAVILGCVGLLLYGSVAQVLTKQAVAAAVTEASLDNARLSPLFLALPHGSQLDSATLGEIDHVLKQQTGKPFVSVRIWTPDGKSLYSTQHELIGQTFDLRNNAGLSAALRGEFEGELSNLSKAENKVDSQLGFTQLLEVYTPLRDSTGAVVGAFEVYRDGALLFDQMHSLRITLGLGLLAGLLLVWGALYGFVHRAGKALRHERSSLVEAERKLEATMKGALSALSDAVEAKDAYTAGHIERVARYSLSVADALEVSPDQTRTIEYAALLHDVGKLSVPDAILLKPGALTPAERTEVEEHSSKGQQILARVPALGDVGVLVRHHHERWDGSGYPDGLSGESIPLGARIIAVADAYDAMTTNRPYRAARSKEEALDELNRASGTQFDPRIISALTAVWSGSAQTASSRGRPPAQTGPVIAATS